MAFVRPTLTRLIARAKSDIETRLEGADALLRRSVEAVMARVVGGAAHGLHGHLVWLSKQIIPDTAEDEFMIRWASIWGLLLIAATKASGSTAITGVNATVCPDETLWQTSDSVVYEQDGDQTIAGGVATIDAEAIVAGADGNQVSGVTLSLVSPVAGIDSDGTVDASGLTGGVDTETFPALLVRLLLRLQNPPKGGGPGDYVNWALEVSGATRAWQIPNVDGLGSVAVYFVQDNDSVDIIPSAGEITTMQTYIDGKAPVTADVTVYGPAEVTMPMTIAITPDTTAIRAAVTAEIEDLILRIGDPRGVTVSKPNRGTMLLSQLREAVSIAAGETDNTITVPAADVTHTVGQLPKLGTITWV